MTGTSSSPESASAERHTLRLAERVTDGYAAKFDRHDDQAGNPPLGFRRLAEPPHTLEVDPAMIGIARVVAALGSPDRPVGLDRVRIERRMRDLALDHVAERIDDSVYLERLGQFRVDLATVDATPRGDLPAKRAAHWLRVLAETWVNADVPEVKADLLHTIYERIVVVGRSIVAARLTPAAYSNGLALALPQVVRARPEGSGRALATYDIPIEGRDEWIAGAERSA